MLIEQDLALNGAEPIRPRPILFLYLKIHQLTSGPVSGFAGLYPLPETCTLLHVHSPKLKDGFYASQHPSIPASGLAGLGHTARIKLTASGFSGIGVFLHR
jgi:hypothetical protein